MTKLMDAIDVEVPTGQKLLAILEATGQASRFWDPKDPADVELAKAEFDKARANGYVAYQIEGGGGSVAKNFNPEAEKIVMAPQMVGG